jgi:TM2 domain-containing membrane protein YozV
MFRKISTSFLSLPKKARTSLIISLIMPGAGHVYNREVVKGVLLWSMAMGFIIWGWTSRTLYNEVYRATLEHTGMADIATAQASAAVPWLWVPVIFYIIVLVFSSYDAYLVTGQIIRMIERERKIRQAAKDEILREHESQVTEH